MSAIAGEVAGFDHASPKDQPVASQPARVLMAHGGRDENSSEVEPVIWLQTWSDDGFHMVLKFRMTCACWMFNPGQRSKVDGAVKYCTKRKMTKTGAADFLSCFKFKFFKLHTYTWYDNVENIKTYSVAKEANSYHLKGYFFSGLIMFKLFMCDWPTTHCLEQKQKMTTYLFKVVTPWARLKLYLLLWGLRKLHILRFQHGYLPSIYICSFMFLIVPTVPTCNANTSCLLPASSCLPGSASTMWLLWSFLSKPGMMWKLGMRRSKN